MVRPTQKLLDIDPDTGRILEDDENIDREDLKADQDKAIDDIISEFEKSDDNVVYRASVNKVPDGYKKGGKEEWCFDVDSAEITGMRLKLRDEYGAGIYRVRVYKNNKLIRQFDYHIAKPSIARPIAGSNDNPALNAMAEQIRTLSENQSRLMERLLNGNAENRSRDPFEDMERMSRIMANMRPTAAEIPVSGGMNMKDGMDLFTRGMELASEMRGEGGDSWISVFKELFKNLPVADILGNLAKLQNQRPQLPAPQMNGPRVVAQPPQNNNPTGSNSPAQNGEQLQANMRYLIQKAMNNSDPGLYAEWLCDNADPQLLRQMANDPNVLNQLSVIFPALNQPNIRQWFVELVENVKTLLAEFQQQADNGPGIGPQVAMHGNDAGTPDTDTDHAGGNSGDQDHPETDAHPGQDRPQEFPN